MPWQIHRLRMSPRFTAALAWMMGAVVPLAACSAPPTLPLQVEKDIDLPGDTSRFDYESLDPDRHLLFIAHLGANEILCFDTRAEQVAARIPGIANVHGVLAVPELKRLYATATGTDEVVVIDENNFAVLARIPAGHYPDGMAFVPAGRKLYVSNKLGATETVIDTDANRVVATIQLGGEVGNSQFDSGSGHIFVNVQTRAELVEIDPATDTIIARHRLPDAKSNHGLQIVPDQRLALIADEESSKLLVLDLRSHRVTQRFDTGADPDVLSFDPQRQLLYVASESGVLALFKVEDSQVSPHARGIAGPNAHVVAVDSTTHRAYLPLSDLDGKPALRVMLPSE